MSAGSRRPCLEARRPGHRRSHRPGAAEDQNGVPFSGPGGDITKHQFKLNGIPENLLWWTNVLACKPFGWTNNVQKAWMEHCWDRLEAEMEFVKPKMIIALGRPAAMRYLEEVPYREISKRMGLREEALRKRIHRANLMLRRKLKSLWPGEENI